MKPLTIPVKNCKSCPFSEYDVKRKYGSCLAPPQVHTLYNITVHYRRYSKPNWCPLAKQPLLIKIAA